MTVNGKVVLGGQAETFVTDVEYRRRGLCYLLANNAHVECLGRDMALMYAYPNAQSYPLFKKLGYFDVPLNFMVAPLLPWSRRTSAQPKSGNPFDADIDVGVGSIAVLKGRDYLRWKYVDNPVAQYVMFKEPSKGYVVGRIKQVHGIKVGCIFEIAVPHDEWSTASELIGRMKDYFRRNGAWAAFYNVVGGAEWYPLLKRCGFYSMGLLTKGRYRFVACAGMVPVSPCDNWFMQLGDSEDL